MSRGQEIRDATKQWWRERIDDSNRRDAGAKRMARAQLRRCDGAAEALAIEATHELHRLLGGRLQYRADTLALIAIALANVRTDGAKAADRMGEEVSKDRPRLPPLRFQALIRVEGPSDLVRPLRRALDQIDNTANVGWLAWDLLRWGEEVRNDWCFGYYRAFRRPLASSAESADPEPEETAS